MNHYTAAYNSPVGPIVIESDGEALTGLRFGEGKTQATSSLPIFDEAIRWLDDYFAGKQTENAVMDGKTDGRITVQPKGTLFQQRVWQTLLTIPYGKTVSYGELARMVGCKSAQAVGQAVGANPIALLIPCHRVITAHGKLGGYAYGIELKRHLLEWEKSPTETFAMRTRCERE
ncbi:MAG: methylated-DNA--[Paludibacteraceae bacterium]|nr:methylated-DNA--[protein]-cysteine S-methyltransferase [Paludibacteraceae bacterium]MBQ6724616.1 methylated-DNA--[protein]-cysteine S-methyltransferase [Paludibacteraceae bacterium]MBQ6764092.1 methylated-DNA--[protein]-cysteine S-methyltransferase [Paludibacteraceae bacterium]